MKMAPGLPDPTSKKNGMGQVRELLMRFPDRPVIAVVVLDCASMNTDYRKGGTRTPTFGILHIEPMVEILEHNQAERLLRGAFMRRTSEQLELPLDFNILQVAREEAAMATLPPSRWRPIDGQGNIADAPAEPADDPEEVEVDKDDETGPPEVDMDEKDGEKVELPGQGDDPYASHYRQ